MTRVLPWLLSLALLASCTTPATLTPRSIYATPERAKTLVQKDTIAQPLLVPLVYRGKELYQNLEDWTFTDSQGVVHTVPKGLIVDGASVPRSCWWFMPPDGLHRAGAFAHDWLYINKGRIDGMNFTRAECDTTFYNLMVAAGVSERRAGLAYRGVRLGGWSVWNREYEGPIILPVSKRMWAPRVIEPRTASSHLYAP